MIETQRKIHLGWHWTEGATRIHCYNLFAALYFNCQRSRVKFEFEKWCTYSVWQFRDTSTGVCSLTRAYCEFNGFLTKWLRFWGVGIDFKSSITSTKVLTIIERTSLTSVSHPKHKLSSTKNCASIYTSKSLTVYLLNHLFSASTGMRWNLFIYVSVQLEHIRMKAPSRRIIRGKNAYICAAAYAEVRALHKSPRLHSI